MPVTLVEADLYEDITKAELDWWSKRSLESGQADPVTAAISDGRDFISLYVNPYTLRDGALRTIWKTISICRTFIRLGSTAPKWQKKYDEMVKILEGIRDGKFPNLVIDTTVAEAVVLAGFCGSNTLRNTSSVLGIDADVVTGT